MFDRERACAVFTGAVLLVNVLVWLLHGLRACTLQGYTQGLGTKGAGSFMGRGTSAAAHAPASTIVKTSEASCGLWRDSRQMARQLTAVCFLARFVGMGRCAGVLSGVLSFCPCLRPLQCSIDGAYFGTTFPHLLLMTYPMYRPPKSTDTYVPRVFGFKLHPSAYLNRDGTQQRGLPGPAQQQQQRQQGNGTAAAAAGGSASRQQLQQQQQQQQQQQSAGNSQVQSMDQDDEQDQAAAELQQAQQGASRQQQSQQKAMGTKQVAARASGTGQGS